MKTVILMWNPAISSVDTDEVRDYIVRPWQEMNWSIWEYDKVGDGDRFFLLRVGEGNTGIVMAGTLDGEPWQGDDWSGKGRIVYYADLFPEVIIDSDSAPVVTTAELEKAIPGFVWSGGHSGQVLPDDMAKKLEELWATYIEEHKYVFDGKRGYFESDDSLWDHITNRGGNAGGIYYDDQGNEYEACFLSDYGNCDYDKALAVFARLEQEAQKRLEKKQKIEERIRSDVAHILCQMYEGGNPPLNSEYFSELKDVMEHPEDLAHLKQSDFNRMVSRIAERTYKSERVKQITDRCMDEQITFEEFTLQIRELKELVTNERDDVAMYNIACIKEKRPDLFEKLKSNSCLYNDLMDIIKEENKRWLAK